MDFLKKNWFYIIPVALLFSPVLLTLWVSAHYGYTFTDAISVVKYIGKENTKYQEMQFSEAKFRDIQPGMMGRDVYEMIGMPLERHDNDTRWLYSVPVANSAFYHERTVLLDHGKVTGVVCRFHTPESG